MNTMLRKYHFQINDTVGTRTRKVVENGNIREERYYFNGYEVFRRYNNNTLDFERTTMNISDDKKVFARIEQKTNENEIVRYQYDNLLGSACLELDESGAIISYEEYHPFGTTSYRSGRMETEVSLKRYKYCGKERDEESGLYYYGMRYYAPWLCRFVSVDPLQFEYPYYTPYQYAGNKPISYIDLDGAEEYNLQIEKREIEILPVVNEVDPMGGLERSVLMNSEVKEMGECNKKTLELNNLFGYSNFLFDKNIIFSDQFNTSISIPSASSADYYSDENYERRQFQYALFLNNQLGRDLHPVSLGGPGFGNGLARDPFIQATAAGMLGVLAAPGFNLSSLAGGVADFGGQMIFKQDIMKWNITQTFSAGLLKLPLIQSGVGSAFEFRLENLFNKDVKLLSNSIFGEKSITQFGIETAIGGVFNYVGLQATSNLKIDNIYGNAAAKSTLSFTNNALSNSLIFGIETKKIFY